MNLKRTMLAALVAAVLIPGGLWARGKTGNARIKVDIERQKGEIDRNIYGNFVEHLGRCIYGGFTSRIAPFGREGLPPGRARSDAGASHIAGALAGRQLRLGLPLGGRHRPAGRTPDAHRPGMGLPREQRVRHR
ncbi:MAG: hypothetical protein ACLSAM_02635 [Alistipes onderdonkii]